MYKKVLGPVPLSYKKNLINTNSGTIHIQRKKKKTGHKRIKKINK